MSQNTIEFRKLKLNEYDKLKDIYDKQQLYHYNLNGPYSETFLEIDALKFKEYMEKQEKVMTYISVADGKIVGFASAHINGSKASILDLFVLEEYRAKKLGKELFLKILEWISNNNATTIELKVFVGNENVIEFYKKFGFQLTNYTLTKK